MLKKIILGLKFYLELNSLGERKMTPNEKFEMHFVHFLFSCFPTVVLGTMVFTTSPKSFEYKLFIVSFVAIYDIQALLVNKCAKRELMKDIIQLIH